ncbi:MAG: hypothetical protein WDZ49_02140 [Litorilinea sp.]
MTAIRCFLDYAKQYDRVWWARRDEIARYWLEHYKPGALGPVQ